jgi:hypothetical protein
LKSSRIAVSAVAQKRCALLLVTLLLRAISEQKRQAKNMRGHLVTHPAGEAVIPSTIDIQSNTQRWRH